MPRLGARAALVFLCGALACGSADHDAATPDEGPPAAHTDDAEGNDGKPAGFAFDRAAVLGEWPTTSRLVSSTCDASLGDPASPSPGVTRINASNDQVVQIFRPNGWWVIGALTSAMATLEGEWMHPFGPVRHEVEIQFPSATTFEATATMTFEPSERVPSGCVSVVEDEGIR